MLDWLMEHRGSVAWMTGLAVGALILGAIAAPILIVRLPDDFLEQEKRSRSADHPVRRIARNILAWALIVGGLAMLALPGPGIIVLLIGVSLADFPGKRRLLKWIVSRGSMLGRINRLRAKYGKRPLRMKEAGPSSRGGHQPGA